MKRRITLSLTITFSTFLISACTTPGKNPSAFVYADYISTQKHEKLARLKTHEKNFKGALVHYQILQALHPTRSEYTHKSEMVKSMARRHAMIEIKKGKQAIQLHNNGQAEKYFLRALNFEPGNRIAFEELRILNTGEVKRVQLSHLKKIKRKLYLVEND